MKFLVLLLALVTLVSCAKKKVNEPVERKADILSEEDIEELPESK